MGEHSASPEVQCPKWTARGSSFPVRILYSYRGNEWIITEQAATAKQQSKSLRCLIKRYMTIGIQEDATINPPPSSLQVGRYRSHLRFSPVA